MAATAVIPTNRLIDWTQAGVDGGIPTVSTIYTNLGTNATLAQINTAISLCPSGMVVQLTNGVYNTGTLQILFPHTGVVLRGAGFNGTTLNMSTANTGTQDACIQVGTAMPLSGTGGHGCGLWAFDGQVNWTNGYTQGTSNLWVDSTSNLAVGQVVALDQIADEVVVTTNSLEGEDSGRDVNGVEDYAFGACGNPHSGRVQEEWVQVKAINGMNITVWPPIVGTNWSASNSPQMFWMTNIVQLCGIENLTVNGTNASPGAGLAYSANIGFSFTWNCWVKNVQSLWPHWSHVSTVWGGRTEVRHNYFFGTQGNDEESYGFENNESGWSRCEDNIFNRIPAASQIGEGAGNVFAFNYVTNFWYDGPSNFDPALFSHEGYHWFNLYEGNWANSVIFDNTHGNGGYETVFRNVLTGLSGDSTAGGNPVISIADNLYDNFVGNILGSTGSYNFSGPTVPYQFYICGPSPAPSGYEPQTIFQLGFGGNETNNDGYLLPDDSNTYTTAFLAGNFDVVSNAVVWWSAPAQTITNSLAYPGKPAWWPSSRPWPPFDSNQSSSAYPTNLPAGQRYDSGNYFTDLP